MANKKLKIKATATQLRSYRAINKRCAVNWSDSGDIELKAGWAGVGIAISAELTYNVGHNFRCVRQALGLSLVDVKGMLFRTCCTNIHTATLSRFERGEYVAMGFLYAGNLFALASSLSPLLKAIGFPPLILAEFLFFRLELKGVKWVYSSLMPGSSGQRPTHPTTLAIMKEYHLTRADLATLSPAELKARFKSFPDRVSS